MVLVQCVCRGAGKGLRYYSGALGLIKSRDTFAWKNNEGRQSLYELTDRKWEGEEEGKMDGRVREVGREKINIQGS